MLLIPLLYSIGFSNGVKNITYNGKLHSLSALDFADDMFIFSYYAFVFLLSVGFILVNSFRGEIEAGSITILINKVCDKKKIYLSKIIALGLFLFIFALLFVSFCIVCYLVFLSQTDVASGELLGTNYKLDIIRILSVLLFYMWSALLAGLLSSKLKIFTTMGVFAVVWVVFMYINKFDKVKYLSPLYYLDKVIESTNINSFLVYLLTIVVTAFVILLITIGIFERSDLD